MGIAGLFALISAITYGISHVLIRKGLILANAVTCTQFALCVNALLLWSLTFLLVPGSIGYSPGLLFVILDGVFLYTLGRLCLYVGLERVGVARAASIAGTAPLFSVILALLLLREMLTLPIALGTAAIVIGIIFLSQNGAKREWRRLDLVFPMLAALLWAMSPILRKWGLAFGLHPLFGAAISSTAAAVFFPLMVSAGGRLQLHLPREVIPYLLPAGILNGTGFLFNFLALKHADVVLVAPVANTYPLFSILFSFIFIRSMERITVKIFFGALLMVAGVTVVLVGPTIINYLRAMF